MSARVVLRPATQAEIDRCCSLPIPGGYVHMIAADPDFRLDDANGKRCRFTVGPGKKNCQRPAAATLRRGKAGRWGYCAEHLYGRWVEDGQVVGFVIRRPAPSGEAPHGAGGGR